MLGAMHRNNNLDFLRQFAAFLVIAGHSESLIGASTTEFWGVRISTFGVQIFFAISGYLICESWLREGMVGPFLKRRASRIFPALFICSLLTAFVLGPLVTQLPLFDYLVAPGTRLYLKNVMLLPVYFLPGVFETNIYPYAVNGSLWTLPIEFACYLGVMAFGLLLRRPFPLIALLLGFLMIFCANGILPKYQPVTFLGAPMRDTLSHMAFFTAGAFFRLILRPGLFRADLAVLAVGIIISVDLMRPDLCWLFTWITVPYLVLSFGVTSLPVLCRFGRFGDPSYGMYLYAFPIQQCLQYLSGNSMSLPEMIGITTLLSVLLGLLSWHLIEKPVLDRVKRTGRGANTMKNGA